MYFDINVLIVSTSTALATATAILVSNNYKMIHWGVSESRYQSEIAYSADIFIY